MRYVKVVESGCWEWQASANPYRYGHFTIKSKSIPAHRMAMHLFRGFSLSSRQFVCHHCDNPLCVNPEHLFLGTPKDNMDDMYAKGRQNPSVGSRNKHAKLVEKDIMHIRQKRSTGVPAHKIAEHYNVSVATIYKIANRTAWKHVPERELHAISGSTIRVSPAPHGE